MLLRDFIYEILFMYANIVKFFFKNHNTLNLTQSGHKPVSEGSKRGWGFSKGSSLHCL
jgi:hypothetical protein